LWRVRIFQKQGGATERAVRLGDCYQAARRGEVQCLCIFTGRNTPAWFDEQEPALRLQGPVHFAEETSDVGQFVDDVESQREVGRFDVAERISRPVPEVNARQHAGPRGATA
jgi:hypothetical protein